MQLRPDCHVVIVRCTSWIRSCDGCMCVFMCNCVCVRMLCMRRIQPPNTSVYLNDGRCECVQSAMGNV